MGKGIGLIGNFRGKVGNMVGYNLKDSNNKQTQGVRVYQPIVKNPKSYGQAEQRAKLMPINAVYRMLKPIIDRGQESKAYGNKSRLAWLKSAIENYAGMWHEKNNFGNYVPQIPVSKGSLANPLMCDVASGKVQLPVTGLEASESPVIGTVSTALLATYPALRNGDQITFISFVVENNAPTAYFDSFVIDTKSTDKMSTSFATSSGKLDFLTPDMYPYAYCTIISREGTSGQHLRSTSKIETTEEYPSEKDINASKEAAIRSYMAAGVNSDWPQEPIKD